MLVQRARRDSLSPLGESWDERVEQFIVNPASLTRTASRSDVSLRGEDAAAPSMNSDMKSNI